MNLIDIYRIFHPKVADNFVISNPWNFLQNRSHFSHKPHINTSKVEISECKGMKVEINTKRHYRNSTNMWRVKHTF
jgi:hypothetical protein